MCRWDTADSRPAVGPVCYCELVLAITALQLGQRVVLSSFERRIFRVGRPLLMPLAMLLLWLSRMELKYEDRK